MNYSFGLKELTLAKSYFFLDVSITVSNWNTIKRLVFFKYWLRLFFFNNILFKKKKIIKASLILNSYKFLWFEVIGIPSLLKKKKNYLNKNLHQIFGVLFLRNCMVQLVNILFLSCGLVLKVNVTNIFSKENRITWLKWDLLNTVNRFLTLTVIISAHYGKTILVSEYIAAIIFKSKNHIRDLKVFVKFFGNLFGNDKIKLLGFQLRLTGKVGGRMRKTKYECKLGLIKTHTFNVSVNYTKSLSYTKYGIISIKLWYFRKYYRKKEKKKLNEIF